MELQRVLAPEPARGLPRAAYVDERVFRYEREHLLETCWTCVGRAQELGAPGDFLLAQVAGEELLVVRGADLELRAFYNVCRHRGLRLVDVERGRARELTCAYHGWIYELSGQLRAAPYLPLSFQRGCAGLRSVRLAELHGFVWVSLSSDAAAPEQALADAPPWLTRPELAHLRLGRAVAYEVAANWKLLIENFQESHHFLRVHPELEAQTPSARAGTWSGRGAWLGGTMELTAGLRTVASPGGASRPFVVPEGERGRVHDALAFPLLLTSLQPDYLLCYELTPLAATRTRVAAKTYFHAAAFAPTLAAVDVFEFWDRVNAQDRAICERQQLGLASRSFEQATYSEVEEGVHAFDQRVARLYLEGLT
jgi:glycine betaine catabolism A